MKAVIGRKIKDTTGLMLTKTEGVALIISIMGLVLGRVAVLGFLNPIAIGFLASFMAKGNKVYLLGIFTAVGFMTRFGGLYLVKYLLAVGIVLLAQVILSGVKYRPNKGVKGGIAAAAILLPGVLTIGFLDQVTYYTTLTLMEGALAFALVFLLEDGIAYLEGKKYRLNNETLLSLAILFGSVVAGMADIHIGVFSLKIFVCTLLVMIMASKGKTHIGATAGILLGLMLLISSDVTAYFVVVLSVAGMLAGIGKGAILQILGFTIGGALTALYLDPSLLNLGMLVSSGVAMGLFVAVPQTLILAHETVDNEYIDKTKDYLNYRLTNFANSFDKLSGTFSAIAEKKHSLDQHDISRLIDEVANKTCIGCPKRETCWGTDFYDTYQMLFALMGTCEKKGSVSDLPAHMDAFCISPARLMQNINRTFDISRNNIQWENKIAESRELVSGQLKGVGDILKQISGELKGELRFIPDLEAAILKGLGQQIERVIVIENKDKQYEVTLTYRGGRRKVTAEALAVIEGVIGKRMMVDGAGIGPVVRLIEAQKFAMASGVAKLTKEAGAVSGDSFSLVQVRGNKSLMMLSDGMGSGDKAKAGSATTLEIFEDFLETGFDKETAIKMINSVLVLKSNEDSFSTLDICMTDLYTGVSEFVKMGASSTYILREGLVQVVKNTALPMGILSEVNVDITTKRLKSGDVIVMVTDGITEGRDNEEREAYLIDLLSQNRLSNPQDLAEDILEQARGSSQGIMDDMTVLVSKITER